MDNMTENMDHPIEDFLEAAEDRELIDRVMKEITFLSRIYREVMVMYYLDERKTADIAGALGISENAVKQRLFSARNTVRKEVVRMDKKYLIIKTGSPSVRWHR